MTTETFLPQSDGKATSEDRVYDITYESISFPEQHLLRCHEPYSPSEDGFSQSPDSLSTFHSPYYFTAVDEFGSSSALYPTDLGVDDLNLDDSANIEEVFQSFPPSPTPVIVIEDHERGFSNTFHSDTVSEDLCPSLDYFSSDDIHTDDRLPVPNLYSSFGPRHHRRYSDSSLPREPFFLHDSQSPYLGTQIASSSSTFIDELHSHPLTVHQFLSSTHAGNNEMDTTLAHERPDLHNPQSPFMGFATAPSSSISCSTVNHGIDSSVPFSISTHPETSTAPAREPSEPTASLSNMPAGLQKQVVTSPATRAASLARTRNPRKYPCPICGERFTTTGGRRHHLYSHQGIRPHKCPKPGCDKAFVTKWDCTRHQKVHRNKQEHFPTHHHFLTSPF